MSNTLHNPRPRSSPKSEKYRHSAQVECCLVIVFGFIAICVIMILGFMMGERGLSDD
jgi:hypothetical protein